MRGVEQNADLPTELAAVEAPKEIRANCPLVIAFVELELDGQPRTPANVYGRYLGKDRLTVLQEPIVGPPLRDPPVP